MKKILLITFIMLLYNTIYSQDCKFDIKIKTTDSECLSTGKIQISISGANVDSIAIIAFANPVEIYTSTSKETTFSNLSPGTYSIKATAFCKALGKLSVEERTVIILPKYKMPEIGTSNIVSTPYCLSNGKFTLNFREGKKPFTIKLIDSPDNYNNNIDTTITKNSFALNNLPHGDYAFIVTDNCGTLIPFGPIIVPEQPLNFGNVDFDFEYIFTNNDCNEIRFKTITDVTNNKYEIAIFIDDSIQLYGWKNLSAIKNIYDTLTSTYTYQQMRQRKTLKFEIREIGTTCIVSIIKQLDILRPEVKVNLVEGICMDDSTKISFTPKNLCLPYSYKLQSKKDTIVINGINDFNMQTLSVPNGIYDLILTGKDNSRAATSIKAYPHLHNNPKIISTTKEIACRLSLLEIIPDSICVPYKWTFTDNKKDTIANDSNILHLNPHNFFLEDGTYTVILEDRTGYVITKTILVSSKKGCPPPTPGIIPELDSICANRCDSSFLYRFCKIDTIAPFSWIMYNSHNIAVDSLKNIQNADTIFSSTQINGNYYIVFTDSIKTDTIRCLEQQSCRFFFDKEEFKECDSTLLKIKLRKLCPPYKWVLHKANIAIDSALNQTNINFDIKVINRDHTLFVMDTKDTLKINLNYDNGAINISDRSKLISCDSSLYEFIPGNMCYPYSWKIYDYQYNVVKNVIYSDTLVVDTVYQKAMLENDSTYFLVIESLDSRFLTNKIELTNRRQYSADVHTRYCPQNFNRGSVKIQMNGGNIVEKTQIEFISGPTTPTHTDVTLPNPSIFYPFSKDYLQQTDTIIQAGIYIFKISDTCGNIDTISINYSHYKLSDIKFTTVKNCTGIELHPTGFLTKDGHRVNEKFYSIITPEGVDFSPIPDTASYFLITKPGYYKFALGSPGCQLGFIEYNYVDSVKIRSYGYTCESKPGQIKIYTENLALPCKFDLISGNTVVATNNTGDFNYGNVGQSLTVRITDKCGNVFTNSFTIESIHSMNFLLGDEYVCVGSDIEIESLIYNASSYKWAYPDASIHIQDKVHIPNAKAQNSGTYTLNVVPNGCPNTILSNNKEIKVCQPNPLAIGDTVFICHNTSKIYNMDATDENCIVKWYEIDTIFISNDSIEVVTSRIDTVNHLVAQYDTINGCYSEFKQVTFVIAPLPSENFNIKENYTCYNYIPEVILKDLFINDTYTIYSNSNLTDTIANIKATNTTDTITFPNKLKENTIYYIQSTSPHECKSSVKPFTINVYPKPKGFGIKTPVICDGEIPTIIFTKLNTNYTYNIYNNDSLTNLVTSYTPNTNLNEKVIDIMETIIDTNYYYVQISDEHSCISDDISQFYLARSPYIADAKVKSATICRGELLELTADSLSPNYSYSIYKDKNLTEKLMSFIPSQIFEQIPTNIYLNESGNIYINMDSLSCDPDKYLEVYSEIMQLPQLSPDILPAYNLGRKYSQQIISDSIPVLFEIANGNLPFGYNIDNNGIISGVTSGSEDYTFTVGVEDVNGCKNTKEYLLEGIFGTPKVFSPNGDGINDHFMLGHKLVIFDRLGLVIFEGDDGWDGTHNGKPVKADIYFYKIYYKIEEKEHTKVGYIGVEYN